MLTRAIRQRSSRCLRAAAAYLAESLEARRLLSTINWTNRGTTDNFGAYGANINVARGIVDRAIGDWQNIISNFNYSGGGNTFSLTVTCADQGGGGRGVTNNSTRHSATDRKPISADIQLDNNGGGSGWYFDLIPGTAALPDDVEFDSLLSPFTGDATGQTGNDFYRTIVHEIGHAMGVTDDPSKYFLIGDYLSTFGADPQGGTIKSVNFNGGAIDYSITTNGGGHLLESASGTTYTGPTHPNDLMNDGRTISLGLTRRELITDTDAFLLRDVYGYTINTPSATNNLYASRNFNTGQVLVRGLRGTNSDTESIDTFSILSFDFISFTVNGVSRSLLTGNVNSIVMNGNDGTDYLRQESTFGKPVTVNGGLGDDFFDFGLARQNLSLITGNTQVIGGGGVDQIFVYDNATASAQTYSITSARFDRPGWGGLAYASDIEYENLTTGAGADTTNIFSTFTNQPVFLFNAGGAEIVNIGQSSNGVRSINADVTINNAPAFTTVNVNDAPDTTARSVNFGTSGSGTYGYIYQLAPATIYYKYADTTAVNISMGSGNDTVNIFTTQKPLNFNNANASQRDTYNIGFTNGTDAIAGNVSITASGFAANDVIVDNNGGAARTAALTKVSSGIYRLSGFSGGGSITYNRQAFNSGESIAIRGGANAENLTLTTVDDTGGISFDGRGGLDSLSVDDRLLPTLPNADAFYDNAIVRSGSSTGATYAISYFNIESMGFTVANTSSTLHVYGVSSNIAAGYQVTIALSDFGDSAIVHPHNASNGLTINGNLGIGGGGGFDEMQIEDTASSSAIAYSFSNPFGAGTQNLFGIGTGGLGTGAIEYWTINAGTGNDTFAVDQFTSGVGLVINASGGNDTANFGSNTLGNITNIAYFTFNGGIGADTLNLNNQVHASTWAYSAVVGFIGAQSGAGANYSLGYTATEQLRFNGGSDAETFKVDSLAATAAVEINAGAGIDTLQLGAFPNTVDSIAGVVTYDAGLNGGVVTVTDNGDSTGDTLHLTSNTLGLLAGDTLFGGGGLVFSNLGNSGGGPVMTITLGTGSDTVYAAPLAGGPVTINGNAPTVAPGDKLILALAGVTGAVHTPSGTSGTVTSTNRGTLSYTSFETAPVIDSAAPFVTGGTYLYNAPLPQLNISFSENVSPSFGPGVYLTLVNTTTSTTIPVGVMTYAFNTGTNTAELKFPGYAGGILPDGNYHATIATGYTDTAGNASTVAGTVDFFVLAGDADHDHDVDFDDLVTLAQSYNQTGKTFSQGNFDYSADGLVGFDDLVMLAQRYHTSSLSALIAMLPSLAKSPRPVAPRTRLAELA